MSFNETTRKECANLLTEDLARTIRENFPDGVSAKALEDYCTNRTIADYEMLTEAIWRLVDENVLQVTSPSGQEKRGRSLAADDQITYNKQTLLFDLLPMRSQVK